MTWKKEMLEAMKMMKSACIKSTGWTGCDECPFTFYCDYLLKGSEELTKGMKPILPNEFEIPESI